MPRNYVTRATLQKSLKAAEKQIAALKRKCKAQTEALTMYRTKKEAMGELHENLRSAGFANSRLLSANKKLNDVLQATGESLRKAKESLAAEKKKYEDMDRKFSRHILEVDKQNQQLIDENNHAYTVNSRLETWLDALSTLVQLQNGRPSLLLGARPPVLVSAPPARSDECQQANKEQFASWAH